MSRLYRYGLVEPDKGLKAIVNAGKKKGSKFDKSELGSALDEMYQQGAFSDLELDDAALVALMGTGGEQQRFRAAGGS